MELIEVKNRGQKLKGLLFALTGCLLLLAFGFQPVKAQTFAEWFSQKKTQKKYLVQQIAALEQYGAYVKEGYAIARNGWGGISNWVMGEFGLHAAYYSSLRRVNPEIKNNPKADSIMTYGQLIAREFDQLEGLAYQDAGNRDYVSKVKAAVLAETDKDLAELELVMTDGKAQLTDDERMERLGVIDERVKDQLVFSGSFCHAVRVLILQRKQGLQDIQKVGRYYEDE